MRPKLTDEQKQANKEYKKTRGRTPEEMKARKKEMQEECRKIEDDPDLVVVSVKKLLEWEIGYTEHDLQDLYAVGCSREQLWDLINAYTVGRTTGNMFKWEVRGCENLKIVPCLMVNDDMNNLIPMYDTEFNPMRVRFGAEESLQVEVLQRMLNTKQITWDTITELELSPKVFDVLEFNHRSGQKWKDYVTKELNYEILKHERSHAKLVELRELEDK